VSARRAAVLASAAALATGSVVGSVAGPAAGAAGVAVAAPWDGPPVPGVEVAWGGHGPDGAPFVGEHAILQSPSQPTGSGSLRDAWSCSVDPGDGSETGGYWRAQDHQVSAPCALAHTYAEAGTYTVTITVSDDEGTTVTSTRDLAVGVRPVEVVEAGVQGSVVRLPAAASGGTWTAVDPDDPLGREAEDSCRVDQPRGERAGTVRCYDVGRWRLHLDAVDGRESRALEVDVADAAPDPGAARVVHRGDGRALSRVRVGERVLLRVPHGHPGVAPGVGTGSERVRCRIGLGDGQVHAFGQGAGPDCVIGVAWQESGRLRVRTVVTDRDGDRARSWSTVRVRHRDVLARATGTLRDGSELRSWGRLRRDGAHGRLRLDTAEGVAVRQQGPVRVEVGGKAVTLVAPVTRDGERGWQMSVDVPRDGGPVQVRVWSPTTGIDHAGRVPHRVRVGRASAG